MSLSPERLAAIRALGEDEFRTVLTMDDAVDDLLREVDDLRHALRQTASLLRSSADRLELGSNPNPTNLRYAALAADEIAGGAR